jgi:hypothetical protein
MIVNQKYYCPVIIPGMLMLPFLLNIFFLVYIILWGHASTSKEMFVLQKVPIRITSILTLGSIQAFVPSAGHHDSQWS